MSRQVIPFDHNRLLKRIAGEILEPVGLYQIGRSRSWIDDHGWWATLVSFGASGFDRGSYLNVGVSLLWAAHGALSLDIDLKSAWKTPMARFDAQFIEARRPDWWERDVRAFAAGAVEHIETIRNRRNDVADVRSRLGASDRFWDRYHRAVASGLLEEWEASRRGLDSLIEEAEATGWDWMVNTRPISLAFQQALGDRTAFAALVASQVQRSRSEAKLRPFDQSRLLAALIAAA